MVVLPAFAEKQQKGRLPHLALTFDPVAGLSNLWKEMAEVDADGDWMALPPSTTLLFADSPEFLYVLPEYKVLASIAMKREKKARKTGKLSLKHECEEQVHMPFCDTLLCIYIQSFCDSHDHMLSMHDVERKLKMDTTIHHRLVAPLMVLCIFSEPPCSGLRQSSTIERPKDMLESFALFL